MAHKRAFIMNLNGIKTAIKVADGDVYPINYIYIIIYVAFMVADIVTPVNTPGIGLYSAAAIITILLWLKDEVIKATVMNNIYLIIWAALPVVAIVIPFKTLGVLYYLTIPVAMIIFLLWINDKIMNEG